jgi:hypothetical protein
MGWTGRDREKEGFLTPTMDCMEEEEEKKRNNLHLLLQVLNNTLRPSKRD